MGIGNILDGKKEREKSGFEERESGTIKEKKSRRKTLDDDVQALIESCRRYQVCGLWQKTELFPVNSG